MASAKINLLWKKLETILSQLAKSSQIWLLEKFLEEANKSALGTGIICSKILYLKCSTFFQAKKVVLKNQP